jgi:hypothetical protein
LTWGLGVTDRGCTVVCRTACHAAFPLHATVTQVLLHASLRTGFVRMHAVRCDIACTVLCGFSMRTARINLPAEPGSTTVTGPLCRAVFAVFQAASGASSSKTRGRQLASTLGERLHGQWRHQQQWHDNGWAWHSRQHCRCPGWWACESQQQRCDCCCV